LWPAAQNLCQDKPRLELGLSPTRILIQYLIPSDRQATLWLYLFYGGA